jgi:NADH-quinone oxidoreductase subunit N
VYEGAPTPITGFMATGVKAAAFAALVRLFLAAWGGGETVPIWSLSYGILYVLAVLTMSVGNLVALAQQNLKRLLAYSSIAHAGYLLVGVTAIISSPDGVSAFNAAEAVMFYLLAYLFMNLGAFAVIVAMGRDQRGGDYLPDYAGLSRSRPDLAALLALFLLSMTGVPPLAGFLGKFYLFQAAVHNRLYNLVVIAVLNSVVSAYYYLRVIVIMYMQPEPEPKPAVRVERGPTLALVCLVAAVMTVILGLFPTRFLAIVVDALKHSL